MKDLQIKKLIEAEKKRQKKVINLIASENYVSKDVLEALGSELTNKYAEGYPGRRYYGGNEIIDKIETLCQERALKLFKLDPKEWHVNVQALSGSPANLAVYVGLIGITAPIINNSSSLKASQSLNGQTPLLRSPKASYEGQAITPPSLLASSELRRASNNNQPLTINQLPITNYKLPKIMGLSLAHGGHLTHGHKVSATGKFWTQVPYELDPVSERLNYDKLREIAMKEKPAIIVSGFTAYPRMIDWKRMREVADSAQSIMMVDMSHIAGLVAGEVYPSPFAYADVVTTTTHKTLRGPRAALIFVRKDSRELDRKIDKAVFPGLQGGPHINQIAAVAVALKEAAAPTFKKYAGQIVKNASVLAAELKNLGWRLISGGTDTHLILVDTWNDGKKNDKGAGGVTGKEASERLEKAGIIVNKNAIPFDKRPPADPSGIRLGTAAETTRGRKEKDFKNIAKSIDKILRGE